MCLVISVTKLSLLNTQADVRLAYHHVRIHHSTTQFINCAGLLSVPVFQDICIAQRGVVVLASMHLSMASHYRRAFAPSFESQPQHNSMPCVCAGVYNQAHIHVHVCVHVVSMQRTCLVLPHQCRPSGCTQTGWTAAPQG
jgi:hypothetical protein